MKRPKCLLQLRLIFRLSPGDMLTFHQVQLFHPNFIRSHLCKKQLSFPLFFFSTVFSLMSLLLSLYFFFLYFLFLAYFLFLLLFFFGGGGRRHRFDLVSLTCGVLISQTTHYLLVFVLRFNDGLKALGKTAPSKRPLPMFVMVEKEGKKVEEHNGLEKEVEEGEGE